MTKKILEFALEDGGEVLVEVLQPEASGPQRFADTDPVTEKMETTFESATQTIRVLANKLLSPLRALEVSPDEVEVNFGVNFGGKAGVILASATTDVNCAIKLTWKKPIPTDSYSKSQLN